MLIFPAVMSMSLDPPINSKFGGVKIILKTVDNFGKARSRFYPVGNQVFILQSSRKPVLQTSSMAVTYYQQLWETIYLQSKPKLIAHLGLLVSWKLELQAGPAKQILHTGPI